METRLGVWYGWEDGLLNCRVCDMGVCLGCLGCEPDHENAESLLGESIERETPSPESS